MAEPSSSTAITTSSSPSSSSQRRELQGPRPAPLRVRRNISKVRQPVIIYTVSPKVVHAEPSEFMSVVQRLTGAPSSSQSAPPPPGDTTHSLPPFPFFSSSSLPPAAPQFPFQLLHHQHQQAVSPAARLASMQPQHAARRNAAAVPSSGVFGADAVGGLPPLPSILSPGPGSLPAVPPSFFSPPAGASSGDASNLFGELISPEAFLAATTGGASQITYPPRTSSLPSPPGAHHYWDLFNNYDHNM